MADATFERPGSNERLELPLDSSEELAICTLDARGYIQTWNPGAARLTGYAAEEIIGQHLVVSRRVV